MGLEPFLSTHFPMMHLGLLVPLFFCDENVRAGAMPACGLTCPPWDAHCTECPGVTDAAISGL